MGRGLLTGQFKKPEDIPEGDTRKNMPRFESEAFYTNLELVRELEKVSKRKGSTPTQLAIAWAKQSTKGDPVVIPIPGATTEARVLENSKEVELSEDDLVEIESILDRFKVVGGRYPAAALAHSEG